jgi:ABC-type polar amino acid transport system ATPase subunit
MRDAGKTLFLVTHQAALLDGVADEFVFMEGGRIVSRTRDRQSSERVAREGASRERSTQERPSR